METTLATSCGKVIIRPTRAEDAVALRELRLEALWMHPESFSSDHASSAARPAAHWIERARLGSGETNQITCVAQALEGGELVAMCGLHREEGAKLHHSANLWGVYVRPAWRGFRIANALIDACEQWARERGIRIIRLAVVVSNHAAIRCYQRRGFVAYGKSPDVICVNGTTYDELLMSKRLVPGGADPTSGG